MPLHKTSAAAAKRNRYIGLHMKKIYLANNLNCLIQWKVRHFQIFVHSSLLRMSWTIVFHVYYLLDKSAILRPHNVSLLRRNVRASRDTANNRHAWWVSAAGDSNIFRMTTVVHAQTIMAAVEQRGLVSCAVHIVQPYRTSSFTTSIAQIDTTPARTDKNNNSTEDMVW